VLEYPEHVCLVFSDPSEEEQTCLNRNDPSNPAHEYVRYMSVGLAAVENPRRAAMIGLGGGAAVHMMRRAVLHLKLDVIEIDPVVVKAAFLHFGIRESADLDIIESDGRDFIEKTDKKWDLVLLDAFGEDFIPFHLTTVEFLREVKSRLEPDGVVVSNVWRSDKRLFRSMIKTYLGVFDRVFVFPCRLTGNAVVMGATGKAAKSCEAIAEQAARLNRKIDFPFDFQEAPSRCEEGGAIDVSGVPILLDERPEKAQAPGVM
jgi:spermidine synthase